MTPEKVSTFRGTIYIERKRTLISYRPPTKFREGNIYSCVCLLCLFTGAPPCRARGPRPLCAGSWPCPQDMFKLVQLRPHCTVPPSPTDMFKLGQFGPHCTGIHIPTPRQTCSLLSTYGRQVGSGHPTGMLSCLIFTAARCEQQN